MAPDQTPVSAAPQTKYLTTYDLKERGWMATMIAELLRGFFFQKGRFTR